MARTASGKTFVGFGFGPIQSALFLYEAWQSGHFSRFVVAEVDARMVQAIRDNGGAYHINIARKGRTDQAKLEGVELYNPSDPEDRARLLAAVADSDEIATCLPSVAFFDAGGQTSVARTLAQGLSRRTKPLPTIIYTAENHNHAAELLDEAVRRHASPRALDGVQFLNTVIGKMSGVIAEPEAIARLALAPMTPDTPKAILVEEFNRILISRIALNGYRRGIDVFVEKDDLLPFEEAKLYGHNAIHALIGYLAERRGLITMAQASAHADIMQTARRAFIDESGAALIRRHAALDDPLFAPAGYAAYADDLLERMVRPNLNDLVARVCRDPARKLGYDDRFFGTLRLALRHGIEPRHMALGAAAALAFLIRNGAAAEPQAGELCREPLSPQNADRLLRSLWQDKADGDASRLIDLTWQAMQQLPS